MHKGNGRILYINEPAAATGPDAPLSRLLSAAENAPFDLVVERSTDAALVSIVDHRPDVVLMPAADGADTRLEDRIAPIKARAERLPVLAVAAGVTPEAAASAARSGADDCIDVARLDTFALARLLEYAARGARAETSLAHVTDRYRLLSRQLSYAATHDDLTKLVNRRALERRLALVIEECSAKHSVHALCYLDLDQFKIINDTWGHEAGDELLRQLSRYIGERVAKEDTLARLGGDEFALLLRDRDISEAAAVAESLLETIRGFQFHWEGRSCDVRASIGVVPIDRDTASLSQVLGAADTACYTAKEKGRNRVHVTQPDDKTVKRRISEMHLVVDAKHALQENRMKLFQQPILPLRSRTGEALMFEVLIRMQDWDGDLISPGAFLPAIERYDLGRKVDRWVLVSFLQWMSARPEMTARLSHASINLSGLSIGDVKFLEFMCGALDTHAIPAEKLCFEVTETAAVQNLGAAQSFISTLKQRGCRFALDDFGSGLSSFRYLKNLPVDFLKIDGMFVTGLRENETDRLIVKAINDVAHSMGLLTIAEFVEDDETLRIASDLGVDFAQGYGVGRPGPIDDLDEARHAAPPPELHDCSL